MQSSSFSVPKYQRKLRTSQSGVFVVIASAALAGHTMLYSAHVHIAFQFMTPAHFLQRGLGAASLFLAAHALAATAPADPTPEQVIGAYAGKCRSLADAPKPMGEWDLKGNARLPAYCDCYATLFFERAIKAAAYMQANNGKPPPGTVKQVHAQENAMRNTCRKEFGLPTAVMPKLVAPTKK